MSRSAARPTPRTDDPDTGGFFAAAERDELAVRVCGDCDQVLHMPKSFCHRCGSWNTDWRTIAPRGTLWSWTTTERRLNPSFEPPFTVVVVELDEAPGTRLVGYLPGRPDLALGMPMRAAFEHADDGATLVQWVPKASAERS